MSAEKAAKTTDLDTILRSEVHACSPALEFAPLDRCIELRSDVLDEGGDYLDTEKASLYSVLTSYFNGEDQTAESLKALEDCLLFGLTEIAKQRAKLST